MLKNKDQTIYGSKRIQGETTMSTKEDEKFVKNLTKLLWLHAAHELYVMLL